MTSAFARLSKSGIAVEGFGESIKRLTENICFQLSESENSTITPAVSAELYVAMVDLAEIEPIHR